MRGPAKESDARDRRIARRRAIRRISNGIPFGSSDPGRMATPPGSCSLQPGFKPDDDGLRVVCGKRIVVVGDHEDLPVVDRGNAFDLWLG